VVPVDLNCVLVRAHCAAAWVTEFLHRAVAALAEDSTASGLHAAAAAPAAHAAAEAVADWLRFDERGLLLPAAGKAAGEAAGKAVGGQVEAEAEVEVRLGSGLAEGFAVAARARRDAVMGLMWLPVEGRWADLLLSSSSSSSSAAACEVVGKGHPADVTSLAGWAAPLWAGLGRGLPLPDQALAVASLLSSGLLQPGGAFATVNGLDPGGSGQQWDAPNAWAPLQAMLVHGLADLVDTAVGPGTPATPKEVAGAAAVSGPALAAELAARWLEANRVGFATTGVMFEKYDGRVPGQYGGGGEYEPQAGFGWTNSVALELIAALHARNDGSSGGGSASAERGDVREVRRALARGALLPH